MTVQLNQIWKSTYNSILFLCLYLLNILLWLSKTWQKSRRVDVFLRLECRCPWCWNIDSTIASSLMQCFPDRHQLYTLHTHKGCLYCIKHMETLLLWQVSYKCMNEQKLLFINNTEYWGVQDDPTSATLGKLRSVCRTPAAKTGGPWMSGRWRVVCGNWK